MNLIRRTTILTLLLLMSIYVYSQNSNPNEFVEEKPPLMKGEIAFGLNVHTSGTLGLQFRKAKNLTGYKKIYWESDLVGMKHPKEIKSVNRYFTDAKAFVFGKQNNLTILRGGAGFEKTLYSKAEKNGIEIRFVYGGGLSLGITKPVYLNILEPTGKFGEFETVVEKYDPNKHFLDDIYGRAPFTYGLNQINFHPGAYGRIAFNFEYSPIYYDVKALELGAIIDAYPKEIPIMALIENKKFYFTFYMTFIYGRKK